MAHALDLHSSPLATAPAVPASNNTDSALRRFGRAVWSALEVVGQRRAARHLELMARGVEADRPALARQFRDAARRSLNG